MIAAKFLIKNGEYRGVLVSGHAGGRHGRDLVCAGVSSAVMMTINTITDFLGADAKAAVRGNKTGVLLRRPCAEASLLLRSLETHLLLIGEGRVSVLHVDDNNFIA